MPEPRPTLLRDVHPVAMPDFPAAGAVDVLIDATGRVAAVGRIGAPPMGASVVDCGGASVSPGWMDLHAHVYHGATDLSIRPELCGLAEGVTTLVDPGSAGEANFSGLREFVVEPSAEKIVAFLNISSIGLVAAGRVNELPSLSAIDIDRTLHCIAANRDIIRGVKIRAAANVLGELGIVPVVLAKKVAVLAGLPLMVHIGAPPALVEDLLDILTPGDILTHVYHRKNAATSLMDNPGLFERARVAAQEGIVFDIGHGQTAFSYETAAFCLARDLLPTTISTDLHTGSLKGAARSLAHVMSKFLALGMPIEGVVRRVTTVPRRVVGLADATFLAVGAPADLTVFAIAEGGDLADTMGDVRPAPGLFRPLLTVRGTVVAPARVGGPAIT